MWLSESRVGRPGLGLVNPSTSEAYVPEVDLSGEDVLCGGVDLDESSVHISLYESGKAEPCGGSLFGDGNTESRDVSLCGGDNVESCDFSFGGGVDAESSDAESFEVSFDDLASFFSSFSFSFCSFFSCFAFNLSIFSCDLSFDLSEGMAGNVGATAELAGVVVELSPELSETFGDSSSFLIDGRVGEEETVRGPSWLKHGFI